ncbi:hypothetical protein EIKCOROL_02307 [Eikenella corrodens ATCC 23834]|uniref:Uncharacterized protein n=1 Tax=Eikenella corrodens ATCC 23834 TaxID=546274 RepID=C0DY45_EIKCO|nr:hypothetical protein EIKCOROL_02307 [Eikenella corrodens ATCC 23834]
MSANLFNFCYGFGLPCRIMRAAWFSVPTFNLKRRVLCSPNLFP